MPKGVLGNRDRSVGTHMLYRLAGAVCLSWALFLESSPHNTCFWSFHLKDNNYRDQEKNLSDISTAHPSSVLPKNLVVSGLGGGRIRKKRGGEEPQPGSTLL